MTSSQRRRESGGSDAAGSAEGHVVVEAEAAAGHDGVVGAVDAGVERWRVGSAVRRQRRRRVAGRMAAVAVVVVVGRVVVVATRGFLFLDQSPPFCPGVLEPHLISIRSNISIINSASIVSIHLIQLFQL